MNCDTGHLVRGVKERFGYEPIPDELASAAEQALNDCDETNVDLQRKTPLARFAAGIREKLAKQREMERARS